MKRWLVIAIVVVALIILVSPGIVGRLAERNMEQGIVAARAQNPGLGISTESFERGWFTSAGRHRVVFAGGQLRDARDAGVGNDAVTLVIDTRIDHGLLPFTSLGRDEASLMPGLATTVSTFHIDPGNGELIPVPGTFSNNVSLTGSSSGHLLLEAGGFDRGDTRMSWQGTDLRIKSNPQNGDLSIAGDVLPFEIGDENGSAAFGAIEVDAGQEGTRYGFRIGKIDLSVDGANFVSGGNASSVERLVISADSDIDGGRVNGKSHLEITGAEMPGIGRSGMVVDISLKNIDAESFGVIKAAADRANESGNPQIDFDTFYPQVENELKALAGAGAEIRIERFDISLPQGTVVSSLAIGVPELEKGKTFTWPGAALGATADLQLRIPTEVYEMLVVINPQTNVLLATGMLQRDGDDYVMDAKYAKGLVTVNGAPMPMPMPGM